MGTSSDMRRKAQAASAARAKMEATATAKKQMAAAKNAKAVGEYQTSLDSADQDTVSGRIQKQAGMKGRTDNRTQDMMQGAKFGEAVIGDGLGRLKDDDTMNAMEAQAAELAKGFSSEEMQARQEKGIEEIQGATQGQSRAAQAALARSGVKGQAAGAQLGAIAQSGVEARGNLERDLTIANRDAQMQGLQLQSGMVGENRRFDIGQAAKEKDIALQAGLGFAQMGSTERGAEANRKAQIKSARAGRAKSCFIRGTKVQMSDGTFKNIEDVQLADYLMEGGIVYNIQASLVDTIYIYNGDLITGNHAVLENGVWLRVKDSKLAEKQEGVFPVYNMGNKYHVILTENNICADYDETDLGSSIDDDKSLEVLNEKSSSILALGGRL